MNETATTQPTSVQALADALGDVARAEENAARVKEGAKCHRGVLLDEVRAICTVIGLVPLSELDGIAEPPAKAKPGRKPKKVGEKKARPALGRGVEKARPEAA